jgi:hypothetical protein
LKNNTDEEKEAAKARADANTHESDSEFLEECPLFSILLNYFNSAPPESALDSEDDS